MTSDHILDNLDHKGLSVVQDGVILLQAEAIDNIVITERKDVLVTYHFDRQSKGFVKRDRDVGRDNLILIICCDPQNKLSVFSSHCVGSRWTYITKIHK